MTGDGRHRDTGPRALVLGWGNPLRGDDGVAWRVIDRLREHPAAIAGDWRVECLHQLTPDWAEPLATVTRAAFVDARVGEPAGEVTTAILGPSAESPIDSHTASPEGLLALCQTLYGSVPQAALFTVNAVEFPIDERLSEPVAQAVPQLTARIASWLTSPEATDEQND